MKCYKNKNIILILGFLAILLITVNNLSNMHSEGVDLISDNIEVLNDDFKKLNQGGIFSEFIFGTSSGPQDLDPHMAWDSASTNIIDQVCEGLLKHDLSDPELSIIPNLASSMGTWSVDTKNYTIPLRTGIQFHDGTAFNATAVKWSFDRLKYFMNVSGTLPPTKFITLFDSLYRFYDNTPIINRIEIINEYIVRFVLNKPFAPFEGLLCFTGSYILSPQSTPEFEYIDTNTGDLVGTGPFVYDGYVVDTSVNFYAFEDYWRDKPKIQNLVFSIISNYDDRNQALLSGDIDLLIDPSYNYFDAFESDPNITLVEGKNLVTFNINMNNNHINKKMRQAISYAINYSHIIETIMQNRVVRLKSPIPEGILYANWSFNVATYNVTNARELMQSMGFGLGWDTTYPGTNEAEWSATTFATFNFTYYEGSTAHEDLSILLQDNLDKIGIEVIDAGMAWNEYIYRIYGYEPYNRNMLDLFWIGWGPDYNDPSKIIDNLFSNRSIDNCAQVNDPYLENLIDNGINENNPIVREQIYDEIQRYIVEDLMPYAFGYVGRKFDAYKTYVMGFQSNPMGKLWLYSVSRDISVPIVETIDAINVLKSEALLIGSISDDGGSDILEMRFEWGITPSCTDNWTHEVDTTNNVFTFHLNGLTPDTTYYFRASARNEKGWSYGSVLNFITLNSSDYEWYRTWGGGSDYYGNGITFDSLNNLYVAGRTYNYLSYDRDIFIAKFNSLGTEEWRYTFDLGGDEVFSDIAIDYLDNVFITGIQFSSDSKGDELFLIKVNTDGLMQWNITWGGNNHDYCYGLAIDTSNNIYLGGHTFSFGAQDRDMLLVKFDNMGNLQWYETWGFTDGDYCTDIVIDSSDNIYLTGYSHSFGDADICLVKYNNQGVEQWYRTWDGGQGAVGNAIAVDSSDNLYITGHIYNLITYQQDICLVKYNSNGTFQWSRTWGGNKDDDGVALTLDSLNNVYITGYSESFGNGQACLLKYNSIGNLQWDRLWGFSGSDYAGAVAIDSSDIIHILVSSSSFIPWGGELYLVKYNSLGEEISISTLNLINEAYGTSLATDYLDNIYVAGDLDNSLTLGYDMCLVKYDSSGNELWNRSWGGNGWDGCFGITIDTSGNIYLAGCTDSYGAGGSDMCLVKFNNLGEEQWNITWGKSNHDMACGVALDSLGNIYLAGFVNVSGNNYYESCLVKFDSSGIQQWNRTWGKIHSLSPFLNLEIDSLNNIYVVGFTNTSGTEDYDVCLVKYDTTGLQQWYHTWGGNDYDYGFDIALDSSEDIYITGHTHSFGIDYDMFLVKFNNLGVEQWNRIWDSGNSDYGSGISIDTHNNIYIGGWKYTEGFGYPDIFLAKYDRFGSQLWNKTWGGSYEDICYDITLDSSNSIYLTGFTNSFGMNGYQMYIVKFNQPPTCIIQLQKEGVDISEIEVGEFFDIYVGDSFDDTGIKQVRFSSDDEQDGIATGNWTDWYIWNISSGGWNATTKMKHWAFATSGEKEVWVEINDDLGQTSSCYANIEAIKAEFLTLESFLSKTKVFSAFGHSITLNLSLFTNTTRNNEVLNDWNVVPDEGYSLKFGFMLEIYNLRNELESLSVPQFLLDFCDLIISDDDAIRFLITLNVISSYDKTLDEFIRDLKDIVEPLIPIIVNPTNKISIPATARWFLDNPIIDQWFHITRGTNQYELKLKGSKLDNPIMAVLEVLDIFFRIDFQLLTYQGGEVIPVKISTHDLIEAGSFTLDVIKLCTKVARIAGTVGADLLAWAQAFGTSYCLFHNFIFDPPRILKTILDAVFPGLHDKIYDIFDSFESISNWIYVVASFLDPPSSRLDLALFDNENNLILGYNSSSHSTIQNSEEGFVVGDQNAQFMLIYNNSNELYDLKVINSDLDGVYDSLLNYSMILEQIGSNETYYSHGYLEEGESTSAIIQTHTGSQVFSVNTLSCNLLYNDYPEIQLWISDQNNNSVEIDSIQLYLNGEEIPFGLKYEGNGIYTLSNFTSSHNENETFQILVKKDNYFMNLISVNFSPKIFSSPPETPEIPGYNLYILIFALIGVAILLINEFKRKKTLN